ncbi:DUF2147 domain-containing protein [Candidatus Aalborgicola defluviihabitans]|uniref:DUF2147 domain-containing protein n=1 Tax=Candidatus Aalborgicola defluviihabitans TaxID=3386187 RepID=UPI001D7B89B7|nr:DUF2147 domain-containing protein [Burkholderiales bacterium]MBK6570628.1 DUF2147 domain-containing protein [Burkholderiales bacterium]MBK7279623.1 DUF2147 domain-containing protein [Burkholderiales bacterium]MBK7312687.1 DUF2147 domain-containing protein [Burkholderiales bacterium]MBL0243502.1 DUF2147 domain-containing protein [Rhodoferax sp.]
MLRSIVATVFTLAASTAMAQMTPVGLWKTIDDKDGSAKSEIRIVENGGVVSGRVEKILEKGKQDDKCVECSDERKDQPIQGMEILRGLKKTEGSDVWEGGKVLDPNNGKIYRATVTPIEGGAKLQMRGYIGFFYRTQTWIRVSP